ncbi:hypothetical protein VTN00DRAFT_2430 [Thermoascus crustaceus]|uniref:uncharacterized protein n=1 Tax=Thermoascus crustaceus TaxID=5088 RepID=UPI0037422C92
MSIAISDAEIHASDPSTLRKRKRTRSVYQKMIPETIERVLSYVYTRDYKENGHVTDWNIEPASPKTQDVGDNPSAGVEKLKSPLTGVSVSATRRSLR